jgi:hypothetical protein
MELLLYTLRNVASAIVAPPLVFLLIALVVMLHLKNKKVITMQKIILGGSVNSAIELTLSQFVLGIAVGTLGSLIFTSLGVVFSENSGIIYLFVVSMLLVFIKPRLICFSYSGAILGIMSVLTGLIPNIPENMMLDINILYLLMFIGIFHIIEGLLVIIDGDRGAVPVFTNKDGKILGGYALNRYWILPIAIMIAVNINNLPIDSIAEYMKNPDWWPLIKSNSGMKLIASSVISMLPFYTILGYSSVTFTRTKREKAISSGISIVTFGIVLTAVAQIARIGVIGEILALVFMPIAHELMLKLQRKSEGKRLSKFVSDEDGLVVLGISAESKLREFGVEIGNKLLSVNGKSINSEADIYPILRENLYNAHLKIKDSNDIIKEIKFRHNKNSRLGILLVPRNIDKEDVIPVKDSSFKSALDTIKNSEDRDKYSLNEDILNSDKDSSDEDEENKDSKV